MTELAAWLLFPLLAVIACGGIGLLAERAAGIELPPSALPAVGLAGAIALVGPGYALGAGGEVALVVLALGAGAGAWFGRARIDRFKPGAGAAAAGGVYALYLAPVALTGDATFLGYNVLNDTAVHLLLVEQLAEHGTKLAGEVQSSTVTGTLDRYLGKSYPVGGHELLATLKTALGMEPARLYQPFIALSAALAAAALVAPLRRAGLGRAVAAAAAALALSGQLAFSFGLQGGIKEIGFLACLAAAAALAGELQESERPARLAALLSLPLASGFSIYGLSALAWIAPLALLLAVWALAVWRWRARGLLAALSAGAIAFAVLSAPAIPGSFEFYREGKSDLTSESELGPLVGPLRPIQASGIWLKGDYRQLPDKQGRWSYALGAFALLLALLGLGYALRRRALGPLALLAPALVAWLAVSRTSSPYIDAKLLAVLSPGVVLLACLGVVALWAGRTRVEALAAGALLVGAIGFSDALAYRTAAPAPMDRLLELKRIGERFAGAAPLLVNEDEDYAKHFARAARPVVPYDGLTPARLGLGRPLARASRGRRPGEPVLLTLDELEPAYVRRFARILVRRSPAESRPPAGYERRFRGRFYELWERTAIPPRVHVAAGEPSRQPWSAAAPLDCGLIRRLGADGPLLAALRPRAVLFDLATARPLPPGWKRARFRGMALDASTGGTVTATARTGSGRHRAWLRGGLSRDVELRLDGRRVGGGARTENGADQWIELGTIDLRAGLHRVELRRDEASLAPGDARSDIFGPLVFVPHGEPRIVRVPAGGGARLCDRSLDWLEH